MRARPNTTTTMAATALMRCLTGGGQRRTMTRSGRARPLRARAADSWPGPALARQQYSASKEDQQWLPHLPNIENAKDWTDKGDEQAAQAPEQAGLETDDNRPDVP